MQSLNNVTCIYQRGSGLDIEFTESRSSVVGTATGYGLEAERSGKVRIYLLHVVQTGSGVHPTSYPIGTGGSFLGSKAAGV
jgi:hypothetical protein